MKCLVGNFTWSLALDGHCPNHGSRNRLGRLRGPGDAMCDEDGPYDARPDGEVVPLLDCCSAPDELDSVDMLFTQDATKGNP